VTLHRYPSLIILVCVVALAGCSKKEAAAPDAADTSDQVEAVGVTLDADQQSKLGVAVAPVQAAQYQDTIDGQGTVVDIQSIAQSIADLTTAEAAVTASEAAFKRAEGLFKADTSVSRETLEAARRQSVADEAALALAKTKASIAYGSDAPWLDAKRRSAMMKRLTSGASVIVQASFPSGLPDNRPRSFAIHKVGMPAGGPSWSVTDVWAGPADPTIPGPTLLGYVGEAKGLARGDHIVASIATGSPETGVVVPASAVVIAGGQAWCYTVEGGDDFTRVPVDLNHHLAGGYFQNSKALKAGTSIVVNGAGLLLARETGGGEEED
jgi:hypothetical protein